MLIKLDLRSDQLPGLEKFLSSKENLIGNDDAVMDTHRTVPFASFFEEPRCKREEGSNRLVVHATLEVCEKSYESPGMHQMPEDQPIPAEKLVALFNSMGLYPMGPHQGEAKTSKKAFEFDHAPNPFSILEKLASSGKATVENATFYEAGDPSKPIEGILRIEARAVTCTTIGWNVDVVVTFDDNHGLGEAQAGPRGVPMTMTYHVSSAKFGSVYHRS